MTAHSCVCAFTSREWAELSHADYQVLVDVGTQLLVAAPTIAPLRFSGALGEWLNHRLAQQRGGPRAAQLKRIRRVVVGRPDDARRLQAQLLAAEVAR